MYPRSLTEKKSAQLLEALSLYVKAMLRTAVCAVSVTDIFAESDMSRPLVGWS